MYSAKNMMINHSCLITSAFMDESEQAATFNLLCFDEKEEEFALSQEIPEMLNPSFPAANGIPLASPTATCVSDKPTKRANYKVPAKPLPSTSRVVSEPTENCVVFGRDKFAHKHPGNVYFRQLVSHHRANYQSTKFRKTKNTITRCIIDNIHGKGGRFLKPISAIQNSSSADSWYEVDDTQVYEKVSHALRSAKPGCGRSSNFMMKKAAEYVTRPAIVMPVETPVQEDSFHDLMQRQSQILSSLKSGANNLPHTQGSKDVAPPLLHHQVSPMMSHQGAVFHRNQPHESV